MQSLIYTTSSPSFVSQAAKKILSFAQLGNGWHFGAGHAPSNELIVAAVSIDAHLRLIGFSHTDAFPGQDGEIMIVGYRGPHDLEITICELDSIVVTHVENDVERESKTAQSIQDAKKAITGLGKSIWRSLGLSMDDTLTRTGIDLGAKRSRDRATTEYQSSVAIASLGLKEQFASTSGIFTRPDWQVIPQFSGKSQKPPSRRRAA